MIQFFLFDFEEQDLVMTDKANKILVTGAAGFIGFHFTRRLLQEGYQVVGVDNLNDYYDVNLKLDRLKLLGISDQQIKSIFSSEHVQPENQQRLQFYRIDISNQEKLSKVFAKEQPQMVFNSAAQAGVRYSLQNPYTYINSNINGFLNILENCRSHRIKHLVYASSSSVYGSNKNMPFSVHQNVDHPISLYAASKKANELMAHSYSYLYQIPSTGLRFFTVYGPWGRPDMALFIFVKKILDNQPIDVYNNGKMARDFTYIDDIVEGIYRVMNKIPQGDSNWRGEDPDPATSHAPFKIFNIGNHQPVDLLYFIELIEKNLGKKGQKNLLPIQPGDVPETYADIQALQKHTGFKPVTSVEEGIRRFVEWYKAYYKA